MLENANDQGKRRVHELFSWASAEDEVFRQGIQQCIRSHLGSDRISGGRSLEALAAVFSEFEIPEQPQSSGEYVEFLLKEVVPNTVNVGHPRFVGHMTSMLPAFLGHLSQLLCVLNQNVVKVETSHVLTMIERQVLAMMHQLVFGLPEAAYESHVQAIESNFGSMASCGTLANITAMWMARNKALKRSDEFEGLQSEGFLSALQHYQWSDAVIIGSELMHYSMDKVGSLIGLGAKNIIKVPIAEGGAVNLSAIDRTIAECREKKRLVIALVGIAGTTETGAIDDLEALGKLAAEHSIHYHVDAAWGGPILFSQKHRSLLKGVELADTVTICGHKQLYLPQGLSMMLCRDPDDIAHIKASARYQARAGSYDLGKHSAEGSRPGGSIYLHAALHLLGKSGYAYLIDEGIRRAKLFAELLSKTDAFELMEAPSSNIVIYRFIPRELRALVAKGALTREHQFVLNGVNELLQEQQYAEGRTFISRTSLLRTKHPGDSPTVVLRAVFANPTTTDADLEAVIEDQLRIADLVLTQRTMNFGEVLRLLYHQTPSVDRQ